MKDENYCEKWVDSLIKPLRETWISDQQAAPLSHAHRKLYSINPGMSECKIVRSTEANLSEFRSLAPQANILLFTPVTVPPLHPQTNKVGWHIDPFEVLGKAFSKHHKRVRHVPYVTRFGFTDIHQAFLTQADAVVVVLCEPVRSQAESLRHQMMFVAATLKALELEQADGPRKLFVVSCGDEQLRPYLHGGYQNVLKCGMYSDTMAKEIAKTLFQGKMC